MKAFDGIVPNTYETLFGLAKVSYCEDNKCFKISLEFGLEWIQLKPVEHFRLHNQRFTSVQHACDYIAELERKYKNFFDAMPHAGTISAGE